MQVDFLTMACFRDQIDRLLGARVQQVVLPDERSIGLELYSGQRLHLFASTDPQAPRVLLVPEKPRRGVETQNQLLLLLRKWVRGSHLTDLHQPAWERVLALDFHGRAGECRLMVEIMGRNSNIILVGSDGVVLDAVKHVTPAMSRYRSILPGRVYQLPPPPTNRRPPTQLTEADWGRRLAHAPLDEPLQRWLTGEVLGVGRLAGREISTRATGDPEALVRAATPAALVTAIAQLFGPLENGWWAPHVALGEDGSVVAFTPYEPKQFSHVEPASDISQAMWRYFEAQGMADPYAAVRKATADLIADAETRAKRRLRNLRESIPNEEETTRLRVAGELLLTYQSEIARGTKKVTLPDYTGDPFVIDLDPDSTAVENAQAYFRRYQKAQRAGERIPALIDELEAERVYVEQLAVDLELAESRPEIDAVRDMLTSTGLAPTSRKKSAAQPSEPRRFEEDGFSIYVGRNARQNEQVTFRRAGPQDLWLHVRGLPGAHVVIKKDRQEIPDRVIQRAAQLAAYYSRARDSESQVAVDMTERRFVRRVGGKYPGMVTYRNEETVWVRDFDRPD